MSISNFAIVDTDTLQIIKIDAAFSNIYNIIAILTKEIAFFTKHFLFFNLDRAFLLIKLQCQCIRFDKKDVDDCLLVASTHNIYLFRFKSNERFFFH